METDYVNIFTNFTNKVHSTVQSFLETTPNILFAIVAIVAGYYFAKIVNKMLVKILTKREVKPSARNMIGYIAFMVIMLIFFLFALNILNLDNMLKTMLAGAGVAGLAIGLALQGTLSNTFSGVALSFIKDLKIGDQIETNGYTGEIEDINLRVIQLKTNDDNHVVIPNKMIIENPLKNFSHSNHAKVFLRCGVAYNSNLEFVRNLVIETIKEMMEKRNYKTTIVFLYTEFADSSINFETRFTAPSKNITETLMMKSEAMIEIKKAFDKNNVNIPFPIRTLDIPNPLIQQIKS